MARGVDQIDEKSLLLDLLFTLGSVIVERDSCRLDSNAVLSLLFRDVGCHLASSLVFLDKSYASHQSVCESSLAVVYMRNHRHIADLLSRVHRGLYLLQTEVGHNTLTPFF